MERKKIKDIFHYEREEMSRVVHWVFGLPFAYTLYLAFSLLVPSFGNPLIKSIILYIILCGCVILIVKKFLKFDIKLFITDTLYFNFGKFVLGFVTMFVLGLATDFVLMAINPSDFEFTLSGNFLGNWILSLVLVISAAFSEELIYRAYIAHFLRDTLETDKKKQLVYCLVSGLVFVVAHLSNPELSVNLLVSCLFYFVMGFSLMLFVFRTGGIEFSLGVHIANNLISAWFFTYPNSAIATNAIYTQYSSVSFITIVQAALCLAGCAFVSCRYKKNAVVKTAN